MIKRFANAELAQENLKFSNPQENKPRVPIKDSFRP